MRIDKSFHHPAAFSVDGVFCRGIVGYQIAFAMVRMDTPDDVIRRILERKFVDGKTYDWREGEMLTFRPPTEFDEDPGP